MVKKMNKREFIEELANRLNYSKDKCFVINEVLESNFFISKKNRNKIIEELIQRLEINEEEAIKVYETAVAIVKEEVKEKLKHPFRSKD